MIEKLVILQWVTKMANVLTPLSTINDIAALAGLFNWQMTNGSYKNPNGVNTSFHMVENLQAPIESYIAGAINTYNLISGGSNDDPNQGLFNTGLISDSLHEDIMRKYAFNRVPYANYDQPVDLGVGGQHIVFNVIFFGTMYFTAFTNMVQSLFANKKPGLGTLFHPFYGQINNVLPIRLRSNYESKSLNCVICELTFLTSDISHLLASSVTASLVSVISKYFIGTENAIGSIGGITSTIQALGKNTIAGLSGL